MLCDKIIQTNDINLQVGDLPYIYKLRTHGSNRYVLQLIDKEPPLLHNVVRSDRPWKSKFFFVRRDSIPYGDEIPMSWLRSGKYVRYK